MLTLSIAAHLQLVPLKNVDELLLRPFRWLHHELCTLEQTADKSSSRVHDNDPKSSVLRFSCKVPKIVT